MSGLMGWLVGGGLDKDWNSSTCGKVETWAFWGLLSFGTVWGTYPLQYSTGKQTTPDRLPASSCCASFGNAKLLESNHRSNGRAISSHSVTLSSESSAYQPDINTLAAQIPDPLLSCRKKAKSLRRKGNSHPPITLPLNWVTRCICA